MEQESRFRILIVDDEKSNLDVLNQILKTEYIVYAAKTGKMALKRAIEDKPDLILLDILMTDMSGFDVLFELKESDETRSIPVIFITGLVNAEDEEKGFFLGAVDYIIKPFNSSILKARIKTHLQIVKQIRTIERLGMIDALTDIPNRRNFDNQMNLEWTRLQRERKPLSILMIDVDRFKKYNDTYGHPQGDVLLQTLAGIFVKSLKHPADIVARWGGEEFAVILPDTPLEEAVQTAENIRFRVEQTIIPNTDLSRTSATVSIGVTSCIPDVNREPAEFIVQADKALYAAKNSGRNKVCVYTDCSTQDNKIESS